MNVHFTHTHAHTTVSAYMSIELATNLFFGNVSVPAAAPKQQPQQPVSAAQLFGGKSEFDDDFDTSVVSRPRPAPGTSSLSVCSSKFTRNFCFLKMLFVF